MRRVVVLVAVLTYGTSHAEENRLLARARAEVDALELDAAQRTLDEALAEGTTSPADTQAIHLLLGEVAASMGKVAAAEQYFRRALTLAPGTRLPEHTSPKISRPFEAARVWAEKAGPLRVSLQRPRSDVAILIVDHDPLRLVAGARARWRDRNGVDQNQQGGGPNRTQLTLSSDAVERVVVTAVDARGNALAEVIVDAVTTRPTVAIADRTSPRNVASAEQSWRERWSLWGGAGLVFAGAAGGFAIDAFIIDGRIDERNQASGSVEFHDVAPLEDRVRRDVILAQVGLGLALGCLATATFLSIRSSALAQGPVTALVPMAGGFGITGSWTFP